LYLVTGIVCCFFLVDKKKSAEEQPEQEKGEGSGTDDDEDGESPRKSANADEDETDVIAGIGETEDPKLANEESIEIPSPNARSV
jgi:hypothetical protein